MTRFKLISAILVLSAMAASPVSAQQAIDEPGNFAFVHPNADVLNAGRIPSPSDSMAQAFRSDVVVGTEMLVRPHHMRARHR